MPNKTQERIEESALILFSHQGFHETSIAQIAKKSKTSEVTIFRAFGTKRDLYLDVIKKNFKDEDFNLNALMSELTFDDLKIDLVTIVVKCYKIYFQRIHITRIMISNYIQFEEIRELGSLILPVLHEFTYKYIKEMLMRNDALSKSLLNLPDYILTMILKDVAFITTFNKKDILDDELMESIKMKWLEQIDVLIQLFSNGREENV